MYNISRFEKWLPQNSQILPTSAKIVEINDEIFTEYLIQYNPTDQINPNIHFTILVDDQKQITLAKIIDIKPGDAHYRLSEKKNTAIVRFINTAGETDSFHYIEGIYEKLLDEKEITKTNFKRFALDRSYIFIETEHFQDWYKFTSGGLVYTHTTYQGLTREVIFSNTPGYMILTKIFLLSKLAEELMTLI